MSLTISVRVEDKIIQEIEGLGYKPGEYLKKILYKELQKEQAQKALTWLEKNKFKIIKNSAEELIREDRDSK